MVMPFPANVNFLHFDGEALSPVSEHQLRQGQGQGHMVWRHFISTGSRAGGHRALMLTTSSYLNIFSN